MSKSKSQEIIESIKAGNFYTECPDCGEEIPLRKAGLFCGDNFTGEALKIYEQQLQLIKERKAELTQLKKKKIEKSRVGAQSTNIGLILERLAPTMGSFRFDHNDCRSLFDPIDYLIFEGLSSKGYVDKLFFVDIKTGNARLKPMQKDIKTVVTKKKVNFERY